MLVTHLYKHYLPHVGGVERAMHGIARSTAERGDAVRAIVSADAPRPRRWRVDGVEVVGVPSFGELQSVPVAPTYPFLPRRRGEILHLHESFPLGTLAALLGTRGDVRAPLVVSWHMDVVRQRLLRPLHTALATRALERASAIHVATAAHAERSPVLARFRSKIQVIPYIVDVDSFARAPDHPLARRLRAWAGERPLALFVGRLVYYKGLTVLLEALARTREVRLALVGDGPLRGEVRSRCRRLGLEERVLQLGAVGDDDLVGAYSGADLLVLPSTLPTEAFGLVQVEAMAAGLPVVSTRLGTGVERVNAHGETGLLVPPGDAGALASALEALATDAAFRGRLAAGALERSRDFAPCRLAPRYRALYADAA